MDRSLDPVQLRTFVAVAELRSFTRAAARLGVSQPTVSHHLGLLRMSRIIANRRAGKQVYYKIDSAEATAIMQALYQIFCQPGKGESQ